MHRALLGAALLGVWIAQAQSPAPLTPAPLTFDQLLTNVAPDPLTLRLEADLAARQRQLAATGGLLREGATVAVEAGRRTGPNGASTDKTAEVDLPLMLAAGDRQRAGASLDRLQGPLLALAKAESRHRLRQAYLDAWLEMRQVAQRQSQMALMGTWLKVAQARVDSGADPAYQADLVRGDLLKLETELSEAQRRWIEAWGRLRSLADLPLEPQPLASPGTAKLPALENATRAFEQSLYRRVQTDRATADLTAFELEQSLKRSRWSLRGSYASEGDERIAKLGVGFRLPRPGELSAQNRERATGRRALERESQNAASQLESRFQAALARARSFPGTVELPSFGSALAAVDVRLKEGKERPSEALLIRRQLLEAESAALLRLHEAHALVAELELLTLGDVR